MSSLEPWSGSILQVVLGGRCPVSDSSVTG
jgi:hypothetical protein